MSRVLTDKRIEGQSKKSGWDTYRYLTENNKVLTRAADMDSNDPETLLKRDVLVYSFLRGVMTIQRICSHKQIVS